MKEPSKRDAEIKRWISDARKHQEEAEKRKSEEEYRKQVEMATARSTKQNIGMAYFGSTPTKDQKQSFPETRQRPEEACGNTRWKSLNTSRLRY